MYNPFLNFHEPTSGQGDLDEEQFAQRHGRLVRIPSLKDRFALRLGRLFSRLGEQLTHEDPCGDLIREVA
ncbi:MAG: hypothetical protein ABSB41_10415 [Anaerolineales bacterium]|jgi:hypothetical protein